MSATIHRLAPVANGVPRTKRGPDAAASGGEGRATAPSRPAHTDIERAVRVLASHARLSAQCAANGDAAMAARLVRQHGEVLVRAGLQLLEEGGSS